MTKRRRCFNTTERLAAAYLAIPGLVPEPLASSGDAKAICRHVEADHNVLHCHGGDTRPQNCNLLPQSVHREKSRRDTMIAAKVKRIADANSLQRRLVERKTDMRITAQERIKVQFEIEPEREITRQALAALIDTMTQAIGVSLKPGAQVSLTLRIDISRDEETEASSEDYG